MATGLGTRADGGVRFLTTAVLTTCLIVVASAQSGASAATGEWNVVATPSPSPVRSAFAAVAAAAPNDVWAVGAAFDAQASLDRTLVARWDGVSWKLVAHPSPWTGYRAFSSADVVSARDVWAVGYVSPERFSLQQSLIEHWNGRRWKVFSAPEIEQWDTLDGVSAVTAKDVWAIGNAYEGNFALHWGGRAWRRVPMPRVGWVSAVEAVAANDVWAVGQAPGAGGAYQPLAMHWDGGQWSVVPTPSMSADMSLLTAVSAVSGTDIWAVGWTRDSVGPFDPLILHWDGTEWSVVPAPAFGDMSTELSDVLALTATEAWAVGRAGDRTLVLRWNATSWTVVASPSPGGSDALNAIDGSAGALWSVGITSAGGTTNTLALRRTG
jgi:hypothetical protein